MGDHHQPGRSDLHDGARRLSAWAVTNSLSDEELDLAHEWIAQESYWAKGLPRSIFIRSAAGSLCFGLHDPDGASRGFARVITDRATFAYLCDVFVDPAVRGQGAGKALMEAVMSHPDLQNLRRWMLATRDAHGLYEQYGFEWVENPETLMWRRDPDIYANMAGKGGA